MEKNGAFVYNYPGDNISDKSSSTSISNQNEITKCKVIPVQQLLSPIEFDLPSLINNIERNVKIAIESPTDQEFINKRGTNSKTKKEKEEDVSEDDDDDDDDDDEDSNDDCRLSDNNEQLYHLGESATSQQIAKWMKQNGFEKYIEVFDGFSYFDLRRLNRTDLIDICGIIKGIQLYNAIQMKPVLPLRTVYCAEEMPNDIAMSWQGIYLHSLTAKELEAQIVGRFNLPPRKHSLWMEGPYGINILLSNENVEYMEDDDMFLIQKVEYPSAEYYKIILKKYM